MIADEPVSALDISVRAQVLTLLARIRAERRLAMLFISHDLAVVRHVADRVGVMYLGRILETGPVASVFARPLHPYTAALVDATPSPTRGRPCAVAPYPAVADLDVTLALRHAAEAVLGRRAFEGIVYTRDAFYRCDDGLNARGVIAAEQECSTVFVVGSMLGVKVGAVLGTDSNILLPQQPTMAEKEALGHHQVRSRSHGSLCLS